MYQWNIRNIKGDQGLSNKMYFQFLPSNEVVPSDNSKVPFVEYSSSYSLDEVEVELAKLVVDVDADAVVL